MNRESIQDKLQKVRLSYIATLEEKKNNITRHWELLNKDWQSESYDNMYMVIHGIAGSAETFGFPELTQTAREVIDYLKKHQQDLPGPDYIKTVDSKICELTALMTAISKS